MKSNNLFSFYPILLIFCTSLLIVSCDPCEDVNCINGSCEKGVCICPNGFSGPECSIEDLCITQNVVCQNGGICNDGTCECQEAYEGNNCETLSREKFIGDYENTIRDCIFTSIPIGNISIIAHPSDSTKLIYSFDDLISHEYELVMDESNSFIMPSQTTCDTCVTEEGSGSIDENGIITIDVNLYELGLDCVITLTPK